MAIVPGQGTILKTVVNTNANTAIFQLVEMDGPTAETGSKEITNLGDVVKKYRAQLPDAGEITGTIQYDPADATHHELTLMINAWPQAARAWVEVLPTANNSALTFSAFLTKFSPKGMNEDDNLEADISLKLTGLITWPTN